MSVQPINKIEDFWNGYSDQYITQEGVTNIFYLSLLNMLKLEQRNNIIEVGAGSGFLYHHTLNRKKPQAKYIATDLAENMLKIMCKRLNYQEYNHEKIVDEKNNLIIQKVNSEEMPFEDNSFDCYIANLCLHITTDPVKMLNESYRVLQKGGVAGFSVWGDKDKNSFALIPNIFNELGIEQSNARSNFHLNDREKLIKMMEDAGYINIICWNQFSTYNIQTDEEILDILNNPGFAQIVEKNKDKFNSIKTKVLEKFRYILKEQHLPLGFDCLMIIGTKN